MLYTVFSRITPDAAPLSDRQANEFNDYLQQPVLRIHLAGWVKDDQGRKVGGLVILEAPDLATAQSFARASPLHKAGVTATLHVDAFFPEIGAL